MEQLGGGKAGASSRAKAAHWEAGKKKQCDHCGAMVGIGTGKTDIYLQSHHNSKAGKDKVSAFCTSGSLRGWMRSARVQAPIAPAVGVEQAIAASALPWEWRAHPFRKVS